jgi:hypothetical protein
MVDLLPEATHPNRRDKSNWPTTQTGYSLTVGGPIVRLTGFDPLSWLNVRSPTVAAAPSVGRKATQRMPT